jgi:hypothetical protein
MQLLDTMVLNLTLKKKKLSQVKPGTITEPFTLSTYELMQTLAIDSVGPYPPDKYNNQYVVVIIDHFSRFCTLHSVPDAKAESAAKALLQHYGIFGRSKALKSDNGPQFIAEMIT